MTTRSIPIVPGEYYHIYNRGNNKQQIFRKNGDYRFFQGKMTEKFTEHGVGIVAYCLMPTHFHALVHILREVDFANVMRSLSCTYVKSFHKWYGTSGHLCGGDYQAKHVVDGGYLVNVLGYIHLNPVLAGIVGDPWEWEFSDCRNWCTRGATLSYASRDLRQSVFGGPERYRRYLAEYLLRKSEITAMDGFLG